MNAMIPVRAMPLFDPASSRIERDLPADMTIAEIVDTVLPWLTEAQRARCRVALVSGAGEIWLADAGQWHSIRPKPGVLVLVRIIPGDQEALRSALLIAVSIGATAIGQFWAVPALTTALGAFGANVAGALITAGITLLGGLLVNMLIPPASMGGSREKPSYAIAGWQNQISPDGVLPSLLGRHRMAPVVVGLPYNEIVGDEQYIRLLLCFGVGPLAISDLKLKDQPLDYYSDLETELRLGYDTDEPNTLYPQQVIEESLGIELLRPLPRDDAGDVVDGSPGVADPVIRRTARDITEIGLVFNFPTGLVQFSDSGNPEVLEVEVRYRTRLVGGAFGGYTTLTFSHDKREGFFRQHRFSVTRGDYEVELERLTDERTDTQMADRLVWFSVQSYRPEYPIDTDLPLALLAVRVRATHQINNTVDAINGLGERVCLDWDGVSWVLQATRNPASLFRYALQAPENAFPFVDGDIDLELLADWADFCIEKDLHYDRIHDFESSLWDVLSDIARAGRATPRHDGTRWGVVIDRPQEIVVAHVNPRNARGLTWSRLYSEFPDAFRVPFLDETSGYQSRERIVPFPGHVGEIAITEQLPLPGKTNPDEVWIETRRVQHALMLRPDTFRAEQDGAIHTAVRGDLVKASFDTLSSTQRAARVVAVRDSTLSLDGGVTMEEGTPYVVRFLVETEGGTESFLRPVITNPGLHWQVTLAGPGTTPATDTIIQFGVLGSESFDLIVAGTEAGEGMATILHMLGAAPEIDTLTDAEVPPAWDGRAGEVMDPTLTEPSVPIVVSTTTHRTGSTPDGLTIVLRPGANAVVVKEFYVQHRLQGAVPWTGPVSGAAAGGGIDITGYTLGQVVEFQIWARSIADVDSSVSSTISKTVSALAVPAVPAVTPPAAFALGGVTLAWTAPSTETSSTVRKLMFYRGLTAVFADAVKIDELNVVPLQSGTYVDGDIRANLLSNPLFATDTVWAKGTNWTIAAGVAAHTASASTSLSQAVVVSNGVTYRWGFQLVTHTAGGGVVPRLTGGTTVSAASQSVAGYKFGTITALTGNNTWDFFSGSFAGSLDNAALFVTAALNECLPQGTYYWFVTAANADGYESAPTTVGPVAVY